MSEDGVIDLALAGRNSGRTALASVAAAPAGGVTRALFACLAEPRVLDILDIMQDGSARFMAIADALAASSHEARTEVACVLARLRRRNLIVREPDGYVLTPLGRLLAPCAAQLRRFGECYESHAMTTPTHELWLVRRLASQLLHAGARDGSCLELVVDRDAETVIYRLSFSGGRARVDVLCDASGPRAGAARPARVRETVQSLAGRVRRGEALTGAWRPIPVSQTQPTCAPVRPGTQLAARSFGAALNDGTDVLVIDDAAS